MGDILDPGAGARREARASRAQQEQLIAEQRQKEKKKLAESESEVAKRRALVGKRSGSRSLLIATSPRGVQNLGGTANA